MSKSPSTTAVRYAAGIDCLRVEDGVMGDRNESVRRSGAPPEAGALIEYVQLVVEASKLVPT